MSRFGVPRDDLGAHVHISNMVVMEGPVTGASRFLVHFGVGLLICGACAPRVAPRLSLGHEAAIRDSVRGMLVTYALRSAARDWDGLVALYVQDGRFAWVEDGQLRYRSVADIRQAIAGLPASTAAVTKLRDTQIVPLAPGVASVATMFETTLADSSGRGITFGGAITMTVIHTSVGWQFLVGHTSTPKPRGR